MSTLQCVFSSIFSGIIYPIVLFVEFLILYKVFNEDKVAPDRLVETLWGWCLLVLITLIPAIVIVKTSIFIEKKL